MMTVLDDRPRTGATLSVPSTRDDSPPPDTDPQPGSEVLSTEALRSRLEDTRTRIALHQELAEVEADGAFAAPRDEDDQKAADRIRRKQRKERERSAKSAVRAQRTARWRAWWDDRAERTRARLHDSARAIGSIHRTWTVCAALMIALIGGALAYMTQTVKLGVVGAEGSWLGYAIEPMASAMLVISLAVQTLARRNGVSVGRSLVMMDVALCTASIVLVVVPWGTRYGWDLASTLVHLIVPLLVTAAVVLWHLCAGLVADMFARAKHDPVLAERLQLLRTAIANGELEPNPSKNRVEKYLREALGGIGRPEADKTARAFLGR
ncbi:hypothetical protein [Salinifilum ghardaiensis]